MSLVRRAVWFALLLSAAPATRAQSHDGGVISAREAADLMFREALGQYQRGEYLSAAQGFRQAYALSPHPHALYNLARALESAGEVREALATWVGYLAQAGDAAVREEAESRIAALRAREVELFVASEPLDVAVTVDAAVDATARTPARLRLRPGAHVLIFRREGFRDRIARVEIAPGEPQDLRVSLEALPRPAPSPVSSGPAAPLAEQRILGRRRGGLAGLFSARVAATFGIAWPRETLRFANGVDLTLFVRRLFAVQFHALRIEDQGVPLTLLGEVGWVYVADDIDVGFFLHLGGLLDCAEACREGTSARELLGGGTVRADVMLHPRIGVGLFARFSWRDFNLTRSEALLSSMGFSVSLFL